MLKIGGHGPSTFSQKDNTHIFSKDGKFAFEIVTQKDRVKCLPKRGTVFRFEVPFDEDVDQGEGEGEEKGEKNAPTERDKKQRKKPLVFEIYGTQFEARAPDRANRKFRWHHDPYL